MGDWQLENLPWLPPAPVNFRQLRKEAVNLDAPEWNGELVALLASALDIDQLTSLASRWQKVRHKLTAAPLTPFKLGLVSNATTGLLVPALEATALRYKIDLELVVADFGQTVQEAIDPASAINQAQPDAVLAALDFRGVGFTSLFNPTAIADDHIANALGMIQAMRQGFREAGCGPVILQTIAPQPENLFGNLDSRISGTQSFLANSFNVGLLAAVANSTDLLLDVAGLAAAVGLDRWHDPLQWNMAKLAFAPGFIPLYADHVMRVIAAMRGKSKKCLVLDLDNTLWGGVIGDDGINGIVLGQGDPLGEAHIAVQRMALELRNRGVVLSVCSKNDEQNALLPFEKHPDMLLKKEHIAIFQANWNDKASNLEAIARQLNIGVDALVLLDDNPAERAQVRAALPDVGVPELPDDAALYPRVLAAAGYFEAVAFTKDDQQRADQYQANMDRNALQGSSRDTGTFLKSLQMELSLRPFDQIGRPRITQLINKTNQFNLTTRRYSESQVAAMEAESDTFTIQARLIDRFGDNGMISVVICCNNGSNWEIDTWLMSCRVINRRVEEAIFAYLVAAAQKAGAKTLTGRHIPSGRNKLVADHYQKLGFTNCGSEADGVSVWCYDVADYKAVDLPMQVSV